MMTNPFYTAAQQGEFKTFDLGNFVLEDGETLRGAFLAYRTMGNLNAAKDNAILVTTWFSGTTKVMQDVYAGAGHALDPEKYFIILVDQIGDGLSASPQNLAGPQGAGNFPKVRIGDDVRAQHKMITELFGIGRLALVVGGSMGGQQVYEWSVRYPDMVARAAPIACTARISHHQVIFVDACRDALMSDPAWNGGFYKDPSDMRVGLNRLACIVATLGWSPQFYQEERWRTVIGMSSVEDFMNGVMKAYFAPMDANVLLAEMWKWQRADVSRHTGGDLAAAMKRIKAKTFVMPISHDLFFPPHECEADCKLIDGAQVRVIETAEGHMGLNGFEPGYMAQVDRYLTELLAA